MAEVNLMSIFEDVVQGVRSDPHTKQLAEEYQMKYGSLTEDDLKKVFSI